MDNHPGAIVVSTGFVTPENVNRILRKALPVLTQNYVKNSFIKITSNKITRIKGGKLIQMDYLIK
ncbi:hypothetical protein A2630_03170 [Candidatus Woesebacteria bacterium RIFCSPHIGHO2_01_FULL_44_10]|nr:MAG: hypothetical protein A2630_03170 [Candidatus Woesebacteria bacterium RIFCSPHIGHO2_01_FULL_44_10]